MSDIKCPFCQQELKELYSNGNSVGFRCKNKNCPETNIMCGTKALWQELIRTRKALEIIKKEMSKETMPDFAVIHNALKTALEQKD